MPKHRVSHNVRSLPYKRPYIAWIFFAFLHYLAWVAAGTLGYILSRSQDLTIAYLLIGSMAAIGVTWILCYVCRRCARCPLCSGTPLLETAASKHQKAFRIRPFDYATTAQLNLCLTQQFRCMYCGTPYDLSQESDRLKDYARSPDT